MRKMNSARSIAYIGLVIAAGAISLCHGLWTWSSADVGKYLTYLMLALVSSGVKIRLPPVTATLSLSFLFMLIGVSEFSRGEGILLGCGCALLQSVFLARIRPKAVQVAFNIAS